MEKKEFRNFVVYVDRDVLKFTLEQATKTQRGSRGIAVLRL
jgi:hypothetical protein